MAETTTLEVPVTVNGAKGTVTVSQWPQEVGGRYRVDGPLPEVNTLEFKAGETKNFVFEFNEGQMGNFVYEIKETHKDDPNIKYDDKVYRFYISVLNDGTNLVAYVEAEDCGKNGESCLYQDTIPEEEAVAGKPDEICFDNEQLYWVKYLDGDHGKSDGKGDENGKEYDSYPSKTNTVTPNEGYIFTGEYEYVITTTDPETGEEIPVIDPNTGKPMTGKTSDPHSIQVKGNITFTPLYEKVYWVHYLDGDHGKSDRAGNEEGKRYNESHTPPSPNKVTPDEGWQFTGEYSYVIYLDDGTTKTGTTKNPSSLKVIGNIELTPIYKSVPTPTPTTTPTPTITPVGPTPSPTIQPRPTATPKPSGSGGSWFPVPNTADPTNIGLYAMLGTGAIIILGILLYIKKKYLFEK